MEVAVTSVTLQNPHQLASVSESSAAWKEASTRKLPCLKFSSSRECVDIRHFACLMSRHAFITYVQITFISLFTVLLTLDAAPGRNQLERKPAGTNVTLEDPQHRATASESSAVAKREAAALHKESLDTAGRAQAGGAGSVAGDGAPPAGCERRHRPS